MNNTPMWEVCPKCYGEGRVPETGGTMGGTKPTKECPVCDGGKLIASITGQPRQKVITISNTKA